MKSAATTMKSATTATESAATAAAMESAATATAAPACRHRECDQAGSRHRRQPKADPRHDFLHSTLQCCPNPTYESGQRFITLAHRQEFRTSGGIAPTPAAVEVSRVRRRPKQNRPPLASRPVRSTY
jgi:hypothetical protein